MLVAGAGPAGSATATLLARAGLSRSRLVDRAAFPRDKACSEYMSPEAVRILDRLGVVERARGRRRRAARRARRSPRARGARLHGRFALAGHRPVPPHRALDLPPDPRPPARRRRAGSGRRRVLERTAVEELLYDGGAVAGAVVRDAGRTAHALRARLTVGADGLRSVVARRLGPRRQGSPAGVAFVAHVDGVRGHGQSAELHVGTGGLRGAQPDRRRHDQRRAGGAGRRGRGEARGRAEDFFLEALRGFPGVARAGRARGSVVRPVLATGPFAAWSGRVTATARRSGGRRRRFLRPLHRRRDLQRAARRRAAGRDRAPRRWRGRASSRAARLAPATAAPRRRAFAGKWAVERLIGYGMLFPGCSTAPWPGSDGARAWPTP